MINDDKNTPDDEALENEEEVEVQYDEDGNPITPEGDDKKGGKKKLFIIIGAVLVLLIGGGAGAFFSGALDGLLGKDTTETEEGEHAGEEGHSEKDGKKKDKHAKKGEGHGDEHGDGHGSVAPGGIVFLEIPAITVGLLTDDDSTRFLRLKVQLELASEEDKAIVDSIMPRVIDQFQTYLREMRVRDLRGSAGMYRLQMELLRRVNRAAAPVEVNDVLFQEILIQ